MNVHIFYWNVFSPVNLQRSESRNLRWACTPRLRTGKSYSRTGRSRGRTGRSRCYASLQECFRLWSGSPGKGRRRTGRRRFFLLERSSWSSASRVGSPPSGWWIRILSTSTSTAAPSNMKGALKSLPQKQVKRLRDPVGFSCKLLKRQKPRKFTPLTVESICPSIYQVFGKKYWGTDDQTFNI